MLCINVCITTMCSMKNGHTFCDLLKIYLSVKINYKCTKVMQM